MTQRIRYYLFLRDVLLLALTTFGGPQAHLAHFQKILVQKRKYLSEEELMELNSLCQILPGPASTQTLTAIGFRIGGPNLAYLTLLVWIMPAVTIMTAAAIVMSSIQEKHWSIEFTKFIQPMAVGFVSYGAYMISLKTVTTRTGVVLMVVAAVLSYFIQTPFIFPIIILCAGLITALKYRAQPKEEKKKLNIDWSNFSLWAGVLIFAAVLGGVTKALPVKLFENFYRNGSLIFGGGQVLAPLLYTEFVEAQNEPDTDSKVLELKSKIKRQYAPKPLHHPISHHEFLSGYAVAQALPGPVFSFSAYIGALSARDFGFGGEILGAFMSAMGIFLPGTFLIFFVIRFWENFKQYRAVRASLEGITAASAGLVAASAIILFQPLENTFLNFSVTIATFCLLVFTKVPSPLIILGGLIMGFLVR
ncbi:chromate transporter [Chryseosolibacter indicus]|uniref:Chromate transporter n=1 Tax=Chryseosolibacter indicus TaxID=2782351 RepID=A0ABS5VMG4_9BACT|nr:chromate transporter [Chryseosolibacter indicus]MBT1702640.1 chromate transporter [Chryseosolibacter indicus]